MWPNPQESADLVTLTEEILNGKVHFLCSETMHKTSGEGRKPSVSFSVNLSCLQTFKHLFAVFRVIQLRWLPRVFNRSASDHKLFPANIYLLKVSIIDTRKRWEIWSKLTIKTPDHGVFIVNFEHISYLFLVFLLLTLNK